MSRKLKALAALNIVGWIVAVPLLLFAVVDPFIDFPSLPANLGVASGGTVKLDTPAKQRAKARSPQRDNPLRAAREALSLVAAAPVAVAPSFGAAAPRSQDGSRAVSRLRSRSDRPIALGSPPPAAGNPAQPAPATPPAVPAPAPEGTPPTTQPAPTPPGNGDGSDAGRVLESPMPESPQAPDTTTDGPAGEDSPPPPEFPAPAPDTPDTPVPPTEEPPAPETPAPPSDEPPAPEAPPADPAPAPDPPAAESPAPETPAPAAPDAPQDPPEDPGDKHPIPPAVKPPHEDMPQPDAPGAPGPGDC